MEQTTVNMTWEEKRNKIFYFPEIVKCDSFDIRRVHPLKQMMAYRLYKEFVNNKEVGALYIFGSAVNIRCHIHSDIDIAVFLEEDTVKNRYDISERIQEICEWDADVVWLNGEDKQSRLYKEILHGVRIR